MRRPVESAAYLIAQPRRPSVFRRSKSETTPVVHETEKVGGKGRPTPTRKEAEARLETDVPSMSNLKMRFVDSKGKDMPGTLYGKVLGAAPGNSGAVSIRFTSVSPEIAAFLTQLTSGREARPQGGQVTASKPSESA